VQGLDQCTRKPQGGDRQGQKCIGGFARWNDRNGRAAVTRKGVRSAPGIGKRRNGCNAGLLEAIQNMSNYLMLAAVQVVCAGGVDDKPVRRISRNDRGKPQRP